MIEFVAVYGSLRKKFYNHPVLGESEFITKGTIEGYNLYNLGSYPAIVSVDNPVSPVTVEVYKVNSEDTMQDLDWLEGYPSHYNRRLETVSTEEGSRRAWVYYQTDIPDRPLVVSGDWEETLGEDDAEV